MCRWPSRCRADRRMPPLRSWRDFFPGWKSFVRPTDHNSFHDRLISNLLFYQTNYLVLSIAAFVFAGFKDSVGMITATAVIVAVLLTSVWIGELQLVVGFKRLSPSTFLITVIVVIHLATLIFVDVGAFLSATVISLAVMLVHASLCHRNLSEVGYMKEAQELQGTPMAFLIRMKRK